MHRFFLCLTLIFCTSCTMINQPVSVVTPFNIQQYLGLWYEIARQDHSFERDLVQVTADYQFAANSSSEITVINRGFNPTTNKWQQADGLAKFIDTPNQGLLKVSFFGPFYGAYQIHDLVKQDNHYIAALVIGPDTDYVWILSRTPKISDPIKQRFLAKLNLLSTDTSKLIWLRN